MHGDEQVERIQKCARSIKNNEKNENLYQKLSHRHGVGRRKPKENTLKLAAPLDSWSTNW